MSFPSLTAPPRCGCRPEALHAGLPGGVPGPPGLGAGAMEVATASFQSPGGMSEGETLVMDVVIDHWYWY